MEQNRSKLVSRQSAAAHNNKHGSKMYRLSSFAQLTHAFNIRSSRQSKPERRFSTPFESIPMKDFNLAPTGPAAVEVPRRVVPNFSLPTSYRFKEPSHETPSGSLLHHALPRSSTFSCFPQSNQLINFPPQPSNSYGTLSSISAVSPTKLTASSPERSFLPVKLSSSVTKDSRPCKAEPSIRAQDIPSQIATTENANASVCNPRLHILPAQMDQAASHPTRTASSNLWDVKSTFQFQKSSSGDEMDLRYEHTFHSSAYWTGRFMALNDLYINEYWRDPKDFDVNSDKIYFALDILRCRAVFDALEGFCLTPEAKSSLQQFRQHYATIKNMPELLDDLTHSKNSGTDAVLPSSSGSSNGTSEEADPDEAAAPSSISTASTKSYNQVPLSFKSTSVTSFAFPANISSNDTWGFSGNRTDQCPRDFQKNKRVNFMNKLISKSRRSSVIETE